MDVIGHEADIAHSPLESKSRTNQAFHTNSYGVGFPKYASPIGAAYSHEVDDRLIIGQPDRYSNKMFAPRKARFLLTHVLSVYLESDRTTHSKHVAAR